LADDSDVSSEGKSAIGLEQPASKQHKAAANNASAPNAAALVCRSSGMVLRKSYLTTTMWRAILPQLAALSSEPIKAKTVDESDGAGL
jgi:hypothetical protein